MRLHVRRGQPVKGLRAPRTLRYGRPKYQRVNLDTNVAPVIPGETPEPHATSVDVSGMSVQELKDYMDANGIDRTGITLKAELIAAIEAA